MRVCFVCVCGLTSQQALYCCGASLAPVPLCMLVARAKGNLSESEEVCQCVCKPRAHQLTLRALCVHLIASRHSTAEAHHLRLCTGLISHAACSRDGARGTATDGSHQLWLA